jgi:hypothetical protein
MKRKPIYPPTNNIILNVLQKSSKIHSTISRILLLDDTSLKEAIAISNKGNAINTLTL